MLNSNKLILLLVLCCINFEIKAQNIPQKGNINTLEIANWNIEWFGKSDAGYGPSNDTLQKRLVYETILKSEIDIWALNEISDKKAFDTLLFKLSYFEGILSTYLPEQKTALIFRKSMFDLVYSKLLGTENPDSFSTMRYPMEVCLLPKKDIGIDSLFLILLHLKSNFGSDSAKMLAYNSRKRSAEWIKMYLHNSHSNRNTIVLGDWNDDLDASIFNGLPSPYSNLQSSNFPFSFISRKFTDTEIATTVYYPNAIDHQLISNKLGLKYFRDSVFVWRLDQYISNFGSNCSDHYPVFSKYNLYPTDIKAFSTLSKLLIFPNPAINEIVIQNAPLMCKIEIFDMQNKLVYSDDYEGQIISITLFEPGLYTVCLKGLNEIRYVKLIISN